MSNISKFCEYQKNAILDKIVLRSCKRWQCPQIGQQYGIENKAAIALQCKSNVKLIAALLFIPYSSLISGG